MGFPRKLHSETDESETEHFFALVDRRLFLFVYFFRRFAVFLSKFLVFAV